MIAKEPLPANSIFEKKAPKYKPLLSNGLQRFPVPLGKIQFVFEEP